MQKVIKIQNLHCAACAMELQEDIEKITGVHEVSVDFITQSISVDVVDEEVLRKVVKTANRFEKVKVVDEEGLLPRKESRLKEIIQIAIAAVLFVAGLIIEHLFAEGNIATTIAAYIVFGVAYITVGYPVLISTAKNIIKGKIFDENFLMSVASIGAIAIGEFGEGVAVMLLYQIGEFLQDIAVGSSRRSIAALMDLKSERANLIKDSEQILVRPEELKIGDIILVKAGEKIPVDGIVVEGETLLDTKSLTGEVAPRFVKTGDEVLSGCINTDANIYLKVAREYNDSAVAKILDLVENSAAKKAAPEKFITKFAKYYTPTVCMGALGVAVFVPLCIGLVTGAYPWTEWIIRALTLLIISCPCALIISIPLTYFGGIGCAARYGILIKGATHLDQISRVKIAAFDKTGTLTKGDFEIVNVVGEAETLLLAAAAESGSSHPLAKPFTGVKTPYKAINVKEIAGQGVSCEIDGKSVLVGKLTLLQENGVNCTASQSLSTVIYVARQGEFIGYIEIDDSVKAEAAQALAALKRAGIERCVVITGDNERRAQKVAQHLGGIDEVYAGLLPDEKVSTAEKLKKEGVLLYAGDGINDAPVMSVADCSVSMGKLGSGAAIEASDFVLVSDSLTAIPTAVSIGKKTGKIVLQNIVFSITAKFVFMCLSVAGVLPLAFAVFSDVGVMLLAVLNSLRMRLPIQNK